MNRLLPALDFALRAPTLPAKQNAERPEADRDGRGVGHRRRLEVTGPGEALLMAVAGRPQALEELRGPGLATLHQRVA